MNVEMVVLRLLHIVFGVFWAGSAVFLVFIIDPRLRTLGPAIQRPAMEAISRVAGPVLGVSGIVTIVAGTTLALRLRWGHLDRWFDTGWGVAILIGFIASILAFSAGGATGAVAARMARITGSIEGRPPNEEEAAELQRLGGQLVRLGGSLRSW